MQKQAIQKILAEFPEDEDIDVDQLLERIILLEKIEAAESRLRAGQGVDHEQAKERMAAWLE